MSNLPFRYYLITDRNQCKGPLPEIVDEACRQGIRAVQLREKELTGRDLFELSTKLRSITQKYDAELFINDRADIALAAGADGVHCRESSMRPSDIKKIDQDVTVGASVHSVKSAEEAEESGADFLLFGPVFYTASKAKYGSPQGLEKLKEVADGVSVPVYAVGGITVDRAKSCINAGAYGVAGISSIMAADDVSEKVEQWKNSLSAISQVSDL